VSASLTVAEQLLPGWLVSLQAAARHRGETPIEVVLTATNSDHVLDQVGAGDADLGFVEGPYTPRGLRSRVVAHDELVLVVRPGYRRVRRGSAITARELSHAPLVTRASGSGTRDYLTAALRNLLGPRTGETATALELSTSAAVRAAVLAGSAPAVLSHLAVSDDIAMGRLWVVPVSDLHLRRDLRAVWFGGRTPPAGAVPICSVTSDRSRLRVISGCARPDLEPRAFTAGCTPGPWPAGPRREWLTGLAGGYLNPCPGVVNVPLRVPQVNGGLGLRGG
jgi:DNA-binding transcriptional LysR family regulator